jgi:hypothetical protein
VTAVNSEFDPKDPLFKPLTFAQVIELTGRNRRTVEKWVAAGRLRTIRLEHPSETVMIKREVLEVDRATREASRRGRPRPKKGDAASDGPGVDAGGSGAAQ